MFQTGLFGSTEKNKTNLFLSLTSLKSPKHPGVQSPESFNIFTSPLELSCTIDGKEGLREIRVSNSGDE